MKTTKSKRSGEVSCLIASVILLLRRLQSLGDVRSGVFLDQFIDRSHHQLLSFLRPLQGAIPHPAVALFHNCCRFLVEGGLEKLIFQGRFQGGESAAGQITVGELRKLYEMVAE